MTKLRLLAYIVGVALGDGNLSNPNGRAVRLRITCDTKYPRLIRKIIRSIKELLPLNKVSVVKRAKSYIDISCYSNKWEKWLGWKAEKGSKYRQKIRIPRWIYGKTTFLIECLRGLLETDGSLYKDRGYQMVDFVTSIPSLAQDVERAVSRIGFKMRTYKIKTKSKTRYNMRVSRDVNRFLEKVNFNKN